MASDWNVTVEQIEFVRPHENADNLEIIRLKGLNYTLISGKGIHAEGDLCVFFPVDSILPEWILEEMGLVGKLSGPDKNRVKTIQLRKKVSQGLVGPLSLLDGRMDYITSHVQRGDVVTEVLGCVKYDPPEPVMKGGRLIKLPENVSYYDLDNAQRHSDVVDMYLMDASVFITEKLEGSHCAFVLSSAGFHICQRRHMIEQDEVGSDHTWYKVAREGLYEDRLRDLFQSLNFGLDVMGAEGLSTLTVRGEIIGPKIQKNIYQLDDHEFRAFEIELDGKPVAGWLFSAYCTRYGIPSVPILCDGSHTLREWLMRTLDVDSASGISEIGDLLPEASNGKSRLADFPREGIVIRPSIEVVDPNFGRVIVKQRSPEYLTVYDT